MDRTYIESQHIVERYLSGDLTVREARQFEKYCFDNPELLNSLPIPVRVKAKLQRTASPPGEDGEFDPTATDTSISAAGLDDADDDEPHGYRGMPSEGRKWILMLGMALAVALIGVGILYFKNGSLEDQLRSAERHAKATQFRAPASIQEYRVKPVHNRPEQATVEVGSPNPPQLIELRIDMTESKFKSFLITIDNATEGRAIQIRRVEADTNREVRIGINSSAWIPGDYDIQLEGYTWRGETVPVGWVRLGMK